MAVEHRGVMHMVLPALQSRPYREVLDGRVRGAARRALRRKVPDVARTQTGVVNQDRHLDTATLGEVSDEPCILDGAMYSPRLSCDHGMDDQRAVLDAALQ